ncbi:aminoglycoside phosphotransferase [Rathayibacter rathayi]|nr:aminoglycoside phosphotransferase [Rathayibacter rathayi]PPH64282.1 aminoglycoside phosphotransferase [Rathayibacter rathayi]
MTNPAGPASTLPKHLAAAIGRALAHFDAVASGEPTFGWHGRTAGVTVQTAKNGAAWLRVVVARPELARGDWWSGNVAAAALTTVRRPPIVAWHEWSDPSSTTRAELMELLPGRTCSSTPELRSVPDIDGHWWDALEANLTALAEYPTDRAATTPESIAHRAHVFFGESYDFADIHWGTSHGDLHWANLFAPAFALVDWESWGVAPVGSDIANLYLHSLLIPSVAEYIRSHFAAVLDSPSGRLGIAYGATRMLARAMSGDYPDLIDPLHATVREYDLVGVREV